MLRQEEGDMEVRALCFRLLINVLMLLATHVQQGYPQTSDADFHMVPSRLQLFEYESVSFTCQGFNDPAGWRTVEDTGVKVEEDGEATLSTSLSL
ncbi:uncharacterized protein AKAME5_002283600, partial [Lates japonicus]